MSERAAAPGEDPQSRIRHRVANTFHVLSALARMRAQKGDDPSPDHALTWMADTIADLGGLERHVREDQADVSAFLTGMAATWRDRFRRRNLEVVVDVCPLVLSETTAPTVVLAALELVTHAAGHTFLGDVPAQIHLSLQPADGGYAMTVSDTGFGMASASDTFGLWLVRRLAQQIKGELTLAPDGAMRLTFRP